MDKAHPLIEAASQAKPYYFTHSHHACCDDPDHVIGPTGVADTFRDPRVWRREEIPLAWDASNER